MTTGTRGEAGSKLGGKPRVPLLDRSTATGLALTAAILALGLVPTDGRGPWRSALRSAHALEPNRSDREKSAGGYYVGLIDGHAESGRDEVALALLGKPQEEKFSDIGASRMLPGDPLQFELLPDVNVRSFGRPFTTNALGLRDRPYAKAKPPGVFRIVLLGSSMDMGWGVATEETYENRLEDWLNAHAEKRGLPRRFEVLNFAMAAYSPLHRLETFERKAREFEPDLVLYSATRLDARLLQIHLVKLFQEGIDVSKYPFVGAAFREAGLKAGDRRSDAAGELVAKERIKAGLDPKLWDVNAAALGRLAASCRSLGLPLALVLIPRASEADGPSHRGPDVRRIGAIAAKHDLPLMDLSATFDDLDPATIEIAPWDDHPNALGHKLLFLAFARSLVDDPALFSLVFGAEPLDAE